MAKPKKSIIEKVMGLFLKFEKVSLTKLKYATKEASNNYYYTRCLWKLRSKGNNIVYNRKGLFYTLKNKKNARKRS